MASCCLAAENWTLANVQKCLEGREDFSRNIRPYTRLQEHWYHLPTPNKKAMSCTFWQEWDEAFDIHTMHFVAKWVPPYDCLGSGVLAQVQAEPNEEICNFILQEPFGQQGKMTGESCLHLSSCTRSKGSEQGGMRMWTPYGMQLFDVYISPSNLRQLQFTVQISVQKNWICQDPFFQQTQFFSIKNDAWNLQSTNLQTTNLAH